MRRRQRIGLVLWLAGMAGCALGPRYRRPEMPVPTAWQESSPSGEGTPLEHWWTAFNDPVLDGLITRAIGSNLDLKIAAARVLEARAARGIAASAALPEVGLQGRYARSRRSEAVPPFRPSGGPPLPFGPRDQDVFEAGFDLSWEIDVFGGVRRDREAAQAQAQAEEEARRDVLVVLAAETARSYVDLRGAQRQLAVLDQTLRSQRDTLSLVRERLTAGLGTELDVARAEGLLEATAAQRPALDRLIRIAIHRLGVLVGQAPGSLGPGLDAPAPIPPAPPSIPASLPSDLLLRRPDLRRAERILAAAVARQGVARADLFPRFSLFGDVGRRSDEAGDLSGGASQFWSLVPSIRWRVFSGGRLRSRVRVEDARQERALREYEKAVLTAFEEVENALVAQARERQRRESLQASVAASRRALELAQERYTGGLESFLSVLDAERSVYSAEDELVQSERSLVLSVIAVYKALGGGWSLDGAAPPPAPAEIAASEPEPLTARSLRGSR